MLSLLHGQKQANSVHGYCEYVAEHGWGQNLGFFLPLLSEAIDRDELGDSLGSHCEAIIAAGTHAIELEGVLRRARQRRWNWYKPQKRCEAEMRAYIDRALAAIAGDDASSTNRTS